MSFVQLILNYNYLLSWVIFSPLIGILLLFFVPKEKELLARIVAVGSGLLTFALSLILLLEFQGGSADFQFAEQANWIPSLGIRYIIGIDGLSLWLIVLTSFLSTLVFLASFSVHQKIRSYLGCLLFLEIGMIGTFCALDVLTFYMFWELMLIPMYILIGVWGGTRRVYAALKFVLYTALGSLLMLVAIVYVAYTHYLQYGSISFFLGDWMALQLSPIEQLWLFTAFALAFSIKVPIFPLHTWLPDAHVEAPTGGSVILAGVLLKMGLYGLVRFCVPVFPLAVEYTLPLFATLGVIGIVYGALVAWVQTDIKKLVAYSSVSHLGFCVLGYASMTIYGMQGAFLQLLNHGISTSALFLLVGVLYDRKHSRAIEDYQGIASKVPMFSLLFLIFTLSSIGLPLTNGFIGEFLVLLGSYGFGKIYAAIAATGVILGALYMLSLYRRVSFGPFNSEKNSDLTDINLREGIIFAPLVVLVFYIGLFPQRILSDIEPVSRQTIQMIKPSFNGNRITKLNLENNKNKVAVFNPALLDRGTQYGRL